MRHQIFEDLVEKPNKDNFGPKFKDFDFCLKFRVGAEGADIKYHSSPKISK